MKIFAYVGEQMVPIAQPFICKQSFELNIKLLSVNLSARNVVIILVGMALFG